jgi:hypothetical protein
MAASTVSQFPEIGRRLTCVSQTDRSNLPFFGPNSAHLLLVPKSGAGPSSSEPCMFKQLLIASVVIVVGSIASEARTFRTGQIPECNVTMPCDFSLPQTRSEKVSRYARSPRPLEGRTLVDGRSSAAEANVARGQIVGNRPAGCPRSFCGCGAAIRVFGRVIPELNLAANWLRFPRTAPATGMVAARRGHVFVLEQHLGGDMWMAYDANSGGHATRLHPRSLRGYVIVNPRAS